MVSEYKDIISAISDKFNNAITELEIITWLENFDENDWKLALIVLNNFEYYSTPDILKEFENGLQNIISQIERRTKIYAVPVGKIGKSGAAMIYYLKKIKLFKDSKVSIIENFDFSKVKSQDKLILVDDFSGSGGSILDFYEIIKLSLPKKVEVVALTVAYTTDAGKRLEKAGINIYGNERLAIFSSRGSIFGYYPKMKVIRDFCFKYGDKLYPEEFYKQKHTLQHPLGYANSQALIGFEHSIPNNTLPIIWADKEIKGTNIKWHPLFPRRGSLIIKKANNFKQEQRYWTSILYKLEIGQELYSTKLKYEKHTVQLISFIYLKKKSRGTLTICQLLGINLNDYNNIIVEGQKKKIFDEKGGLTDYAHEIYQEIQKKMKFEKNKFIHSELMLNEDMLYIPKTFRGRS